MLGFLNVLSWEADMYPDSGETFFKPGLFLG